jgi:DNA polymerase I-like protein with 3'-5' exonuclease and polymerase domains
MIYLVSLQKELFNNKEYKVIGVDESLSLLSSCKIIQFDTETDGKDAHINHLLCAQFGNKNKDIQIVVDCSTIDITKYKEILENKFIIGQNLKFDLQFLFNYHIIPKKVYDTMIVEQFLHLGYPSGSISYSLAAIAQRRLGIYIDKTIRGEIIWRGLDTEVIKYAAYDVYYLEDIMKSQLEDIKKIPNAIKGVEIECTFTLSVAYLEWCGIKLDINKWKEKMRKDKINLNESLERLNNFIINHPTLKSKYTHTNRQGDLFKGFDLTPKCTINWSSSQQVIKVAKDLGFDTQIKDKKTGEDKDTVLEKELSRQKNICDEFLHLMFGWDEKTPEGEEIHHWGYKESDKLCSTYGQGHLNAINPNTGRLHTVYRAIGTISGRMSSGSRNSNTDLAKLKHIPAKDCTYPNMQQLPHDADTRACFVAEKGNLFCSCDYAAMEARCGADVYNEKMLLDEFLYRSGDTHAAYAKVVFADELKDIPVEQIKKKRPDLRSKVKSVEFKNKISNLI